MIERVLKMPKIDWENSTVTMSIEGYEESQSNATNAGFQTGLKRAAEICNEQYAEIDAEKEKFGQYTDGLLVGLCRAAGSIMRETNSRSPDAPSPSGSPNESASKSR